MWIRSVVGVRALRLRSQKRHVGEFRRCILTGRSEGNTAGTHGEADKAECYGGEGRDRRFTAS